MIKLGDIVKIKQGQYAGLYGAVVSSIVKSKAERVVRVVIVEIRLPASPDRKRTVFLEYGESEAERLLELEPTFFIAEKLNERIKKNGGDNCGREVES